MMTKLNQKEVSDILVLFNNQEYNEENKVRWIELGRKLCKMIAEGLKQEQYEIGVNQESHSVGAAVSLYTERVWINFEPSVGNYRFMWRTCEKLGDCGSGIKHHNRWERIDDILKDFDGFIDKVANVGFPEIFTEKRAYCQLSS